MITEPLHNPHPGEILKKDFLDPMGLSPTVLARALNLPRRLVAEFLRGKRPVTADLDEALTRHFDLSEGFFLQLQGDYDLAEGFEWSLERYSGTYRRLAD